MNGQVLDFGTTGFLRFSNLVMYDRQSESWWQEFGGEAIVGELVGTELEQLPLSIVSWEEFKAAFPEGKVLSRDTGNRRDYGRNPYRGYDSGNPFMYDGPPDDRLPALERVVAILIDEEALAVPFSVLEREPVVRYTLEEQDLVVFFKKGTASSLDAGDIAEGRDVGATGVFDPNLEGQKLSFKAEGDEIIDEQTGSTWNLFGQAISGPLTGKELAPIPHRGSQLWFSWVVWQPDTFIYAGEDATGL